jgi:hypothetical protein
MVAVADDARRRASRHPLGVSGALGPDADPDQLLSFHHEVDGLEQERGARR